MKAAVNCASGASFGHVGGVPEKLRQGDGCDRWVEWTRALVDEGAGFISASTDVGNTGMARAFARAGYPVLRHRFCLTHAG